ncbi:MAG: type II toxin-antitoxin system PemK/MazF family toxin [Saccharofermentans sp.]|nr:type II toxin-antitoxin system PemK/MazF family toxin [Saccharofermentans sp.]
MNGFPLHVHLDGRTSTTGVILCEHIRTLDLSSRENKFIEKIPDDILKTVTDIVFAEVEIVD